MCIYLKGRLEQDGLTGGFHTHFGVGLSAVYVPSELWLYLIYSSLPLFARPAARRGAQVVPWLQKGKMP